jgi:type II secretory pathway pseudopilin PulG
MLVRAHLRGRAVFLALILAAPALSLFAQRAAASPASQQISDAREALQEILTAACRHDETAFANHLTRDNAEAFRVLAQEQRVALLRRMVLLDDPGKPLLSVSDGNTVVRCEAGGVTSEMRFGAAEVRENLAFIPVTVPEGEQTQSVRFGLVKEDGQWKLLSVGLLLVNIPALGRQWEQSELENRERDAIAAMRKVARALKSYQRAYGGLPETLDELGPPPKDGASPEMAGLLDADLAKGLAAGYRLRYSIVPATGEEDISERNRAAGFTLAATPVVYGKDGRRSFFLDASGTLRGADKNGVVATADDPRIENEETP